MISRRRLADLGLALLAVLTLVFAAYVVLRDPTPPSVPTSQDLPSTPPSAAPASAPASVATPSAGQDVLLLRDPAAPGSHVLLAGRRLAWRLSDAPLAPPPDAQRLAEQELVLVQAGERNAADVLAAVRAAEEASSARVVVLGPLTASGDAELPRAVQAAGARFLDPVALGWLEGVGQPLTPAGALTPAAAAAAAEGLAQALQQ